MNFGLIGFLFLFFITLFVYEIINKIIIKYHLKKRENNYQQIKQKFVKFLQRKK